MAVDFKRSERVSDSIHREISSMLIKGEIKDPRVGPVFITAVKVSDNLSMADVYFTISNNQGDKSEALKGLESAKGFIKGRIAKRLRIRKLPDLKFEFDATLDNAYRLDEVLKGLNSE